MIYLIVSNYNLVYQDSSLYKNQMFYLAEQIR